MKLQRRGFLSGTLAAPAPRSVCAAVRSPPIRLRHRASGCRSAATARAADLSSWKAVRDQFPLTRERINLALMLLTSHPRPVRDAIDRHRRGFDDDP